MSYPQGSHELRLIRMVLGYFLRNPKAADNLEGVTRWRLLDETIHLAVEDVNRALEWLVAERYLSETVASESGRIFRLNEKQRLAAERFMSVPARPRRLKKP